ncbi:hypothetical protein BU25DRAFT_183701 [Macroventuria anomochaeta]|uniref:Uncharacterized protein n=1 Tax=Macroventuria anomochaeta TaxID=301207 RepID=A0ACB6RPT0_9PLEO|nr:uncharacterized protein BU25DRAFT_183701 [Macroventuria anomochaeta]KAF2623159.1 hypothetical protein BU25DRAFT_183701 [Macroventuria anomochaeta]
MASYPPEPGLSNVAKDALKKKGKLLSDLLNTLDRLCLGHSHCKGKEHTSVFITTGVHTTTSTRTVTQDASISTVTEYATGWRKETVIKYAPTTITVQVPITVTAYDTATTSRDTEPVHASAAGSPLPPRYRCNPILPNCKPESAEVVRV